MSADAVGLLVLGGGAAVAFLGLAWALVPRERLRAMRTREEELRWWNDRRRSPFVGRPRRRD